MELRLVQQQEIGINQEALNEWIEYRGEDLKKPMSKRAITKLLNKLQQWSESDQRRLIDHAIEMEWRGVYWVDPPKPRGTRQASIEDDLRDTSWAD